MRTDEMVLALPAWVGGAAPFAVGLCVGALLLLAFVYGRRWRDKEPPPPSQPQRRQGAWQTREEHDRGPSSPDHGPGHEDNDDAVGYVTEHREADPLRTEGPGERVLPHELRNPGSHEEELTEERRKWNPGSSGAFGSGGGGHH
ncbi:MULTISPECIES: DUF6479 family protein [Streptomyces]|uniref:DUF6479 family protein n=1 Tax=Streptomyces TaxID=1883 RepID=UPI00163CB8FF|nr:MULTISPECIES: DUF6479 family protein [Streptomyces]MBC2876122.1 hypothetical protein [Streptomyces sp. TYQ1024]UBI38480.1 DUF6479 family protein [Streptomyces mobaraensis]UKW31064.1 DUF6479 family protein [Streptomyces sp. TYQ1024]